MILEKLKDKFTKYEVARILGARSLQLAMDAPVLLKLSKEEEDELNFDSLKIAERELESDVLPITVPPPLQFVTLYYILHSMSSVWSDLPGFSRTQGVCSLAGLGNLLLSQL